MRISLAESRTVATVLDLAFLSPLMHTARRVTYMLLGTRAGAWRWTGGFAG